MLVLTRPMIAVRTILLAALLLGGMALLPAKYVPFYSLGVAGAVLLIAYAALGELLPAVLLWFFTLICLHEEFWRQQVPLFFSITIPRIFLVVLVVLWLMMWALGRVRLRLAWPIGPAMILLLGYFLASAMISGFETRSPVTVHYRLIGGYLFPFTVFALVLHAVRTHRSLRQVAVFFAAISIYLTMTGWLERFQVWSLVWPRFISDPEVGIHFGRVRGPFVQSAAMGLALTYCYFNNVVLARQTNPVIRVLLYALNLVMLPVIFWTKTRSVWLGFLGCSALWVAYSRRRTTRALGVCLLIALTLIVAVVNMENFLSSEREKGGLTDMEPILLRLGLAHITYNIFTDHPVFGVGFGHFRDVAPAFADDPSSPFFAFATTALEHNNFLSIVSETGLVGIALYLLLLVLTIRPSFSLYRKLPETAPGFVNRDIIVLYWVLAVAYLIDGFLRETSDNPFANSLFFGLSAVIVALNMLLSRTPLEQFAPAGAAPLRPGPAVRPRPLAPVPRASPAP